MQRPLVLLPAPAAGERQLVLAREKRSAHRLADEPTIGPLRIDRVTRRHETHLHAFSK
jgi:hypothetical protein